MCWGNSLNDIDEKVRCEEILDDSVLCSRDEDVLGDMLRDLFDGMRGSTLLACEPCSETTVTS